MSSWSWRVLTQERKTKKGPSEFRPAFSVIEFNYFFLVAFLWIGL